MDPDDLLGNPKLQKAASTFAAGYAKRMLEGRYSQLTETKAGQRLVNLSRPNKLIIEAALNGLVSYLSTKESSLANSPVKEFLWEIAKDAPSEISKRLLNGDHKRTKSADASSATDVETGESEQRGVMEGLLKIKPDDLGAFLIWLESASIEERRFMAEAMSQLTEEQQSKMVGLSSEREKTFLGGIAPPDQKLPEPPPSQPGPPKGRGALASLTDSLRSVNERLEKRNRRP